MSLRRFLHRGYWIRLGRKLRIRFVRRPLITLRGLPLVAVTGTNGKTTTTLLINRILRDAGYRTGCSCTEGVLVDGQWVVHGDEAGSRGLWWASRPKGLNVLVAETARGGILRYGLGFSRCHVSVVTNVAADHLGQHGVESVEDLAAVKSTLPRHTRSDGATVLNGDQPLVREMAAKSRARAVFFTLGKPLESWKHCYFVRDGAILRKQGADLERVVDVDRVYIGHDGTVSFQVANAMAAIAAVDALHAWLPVTRSSLEQSLASFGRDPRDIPGRMQLFRYEGADVLVSLSKNPDTYEREIPLLQRLARAHGYQRVVSIVSSVGNREDVHFREVSRLIAGFGGLVVGVPPRDHYLRGKTGDEIGRLLESEVPPERVARVQATSLPGIVAELQGSGSPRTLFVTFASRISSAVDVDEVVAKGELLPMRFDA